MTYYVHPDDQPPAEWRRFAPDSEAAATLPQPSLDDPVAVGLMFCNALVRHEEYIQALARLVTPESLASWGDFGEAASFLGSVKDRGYGSFADRAYGDDAVAYFKILSGVTSTYQVLEDQIISGSAGVVTLVWRPEFGEWRVHGIGDYVKPEEVPH
jgi:hypothetical protein